MNKIQNGILIGLGVILAALVALVSLFRGKEPIGAERNEDAEQEVEVIEIHLLEQEGGQALGQPQGGSLVVGIQEDTGDFSEGGAQGASPSDLPAGQQENGSVFTLKIGRNEIAVYGGVEEKTLEKGPGWLTTSAVPGEEGTCVVYGHRNRKHLLPLKNVDYGDTISVKKEGKTFDYKIESIEILDSDEKLNITLDNGGYLLLTTCYPFHYTGHAPKKYVVIGVSEKV